MHKNKFLPWILLLLLSLNSCNDVFDYSPYEANVTDQQKDKTITNISKLKNLNHSADSTLTFITISDTHYDYFELKTAIEKINELNNIDFVVHLGDLTDRGWLKEYEIFNEYTNELHTPLLTCIGNHDYLSNGGSIYQAIYGDYNYAFTFKGIKLVFFDATTWESNKQPDMKWLQAQLNNDSLPTILFSHIPPNDRQYSSQNQETLKKLVQANNMLITIHGHAHTHKLSDFLNTEVQSMIVGSILHKNMYKVSVSHNQHINIAKVEF